MSVRDAARALSVMMSGGDYHKWLYSEKQERDERSSSLESFANGTPDIERSSGKRVDRVPKEFEGIRSWFEYSKSKTSLLEYSLLDSRVSDQFNTLSASQGALGGRFSPQE